jgi:hypothetical protein
MPEDAPAQANQAANHKPTAVDVELLAERVYKLMLEEARTLKARGQSQTRGFGSKQR